MKITVLRAKTYHAASEALIKRLEQVDQTDLDTRHVVISNVKTSMSSEFAVLDALKGSFNTSVTTFSRLTGQLLPGKEFISKQSAVMILTKVIDGLKGKLSCFRVSSFSSGFAHVMYETITQLKYSGISSEHLDKGTLPQGLKEKIADIKLIYAAYEEFCSDRFLDSGTKMQLLAAAIPKSEFVKSAYFYIKDFDYFTEQEVIIARELARCSKGIVAAVPCSKEIKHDGLYLNEAYNTLCRIAEGLRITSAVDFQDIKTEDTATGVSKHISENLFARQSGVKRVMSGIMQTRQDELVIHSVSNIFEEVDRAARFIRSKTAGGARYKDFLVVVSDVEKYSFAAQQSFSEYGISFFLDRKKRLFDHALSRFLTAALKMKSKNFARNETLNFIKNWFFDGDEKNKFEFENYLFKYNVKYCQKPLEVEDVGSLVYEVEKLRERAVKTVGHFPSEATAEEYVYAVKRFLDEQKTADKLDKLAEELRVLSEEEREFTLQVWSKLTDLLNNTSAILGGMKLRPEKFTEILESGLKASQISILPLHNDCVVVSDLSKARAQAHKHLIILGANEGSFPVAKSDAKLLSDKNIAELNEYGIGISPTVSRENRRERFNVHQLLSEPRESVYISFITSSDDKEKAALPCEAVEQITQMFSRGKDYPYPVLIVDGDSRVYTRQHARKKVVEGIRSFGERPKKRKFIQDISNVREALCEKSESFVCQNQVKANLKNAWHLTAKGTISVTRIETFYDCPYRYYLEHGLRLKERPEGDLRPIEAGNIFHDVLDNFVRELHTCGNCDEKAKYLAERAFSETLEKPCYKPLLKSNKVRYFIGQLRKEVVSTCIKIKEQTENSDFKTVAQEWGFGTEMVPALEIDTPGGVIKLKGKIDRVDIKEDKFILIDYKSGSKSFDESKLYEGADLQLPVYVSAYEKLNKNKRCAGFYYLSTKDAFAERPREKELRFSGRTLADVAVAESIDRRLAQTNKSKLLGANIKATEPSKAEIEAGAVVTREFWEGEKVSSAEEMKAMPVYAVEMVKRAAAELAKGKIADIPRKGECEYCNVKDACDFEDLQPTEPRRKTENITPADLREITERLKADKKEATE